MYWYSWLVSEWLQRHHAQTVLLTSIVTCIHWTAGASDFMPACASLMQSVQAVQQIANPTRPCSLERTGVTVSARNNATLFLMHPANQKVRARSSTAVICINQLSCCILLTSYPVYPDLLGWCSDMLMTMPCLALPCLDSALCALPHCCNEHLVSALQQQAVC